MFNDELEVHIKGRAFRIESVSLRDDDSNEVVAYTYRVWEGDALLNIEELEQFNIDVVFMKPAEAVDAGFAWLRSHS